MKIRHRYLTVGMGWICGTLLRLLARTLRFVGREELSGTDCSQPTAESYLYILWHDAILIPIMKQARDGQCAIRALVSRHQDGSYLAEMLKHARISTVRGSTNHGGAAALRQLIRQAESEHVFITPDGPRGPRRYIKEGIVYLASVTGFPIVPIVSRGDREWRIAGSWTDLTIPKPFSTVRYLLGKPISVPADLSREELARYRDQVQAEMDRLQGELDHPAAAPRTAIPLPPQDQCRAA